MDYYFGLPEIELLKWM